MSSEPVEGGLFRRNYLREPVLLADSERARRRIHLMFKATGDDTDFAPIVERLLGCEYPAFYEGYNHQSFWMHSEVGDFLSGLTLWFRLNPQSQSEILKEARRIFAEEGLRYRIDDKGGVHYFIDEEFERTAQSTIAGLGEPRFKAAAHALEDALTSLGVTKQSGKALIRGVFEAVESVFLTIIQQPQTNHVNGPNIDKYLKPILLARYASWQDREEITERMLKVFKEWVSVGHYYRHGVPIEQIHEPPLDVAVAVATEGMGILRYMIGK